MDSGRGSVGTREDLNSPGYVDSESDDGSSTGSVSLSQGGSEVEVLVLRSLLCNRQVYKTGQNKTKIVRARVSFRFGCTAKVTIRLVHGVGYKIVSLEESHTHELVTEKDKQFMRSRRKLIFGHKKFVMDYEKASIGLVRSHRLFKEIVGGYSHVGASAVDFKNYR
ncbi:hypothetical protein V2J09_004082 [Rumex salicifolius]